MCIYWAAKGFTVPKTEKAFKPCEITFPVQTSKLVNFQSAMRP